MELSIKSEHFTPKFLYINLNTPNNSFYPIFYRTPTVTLNNLLFETPWMDVPAGVNQYSMDKKEGKYYLDLSFNGYKDNNEIKNFYKVIEGLDNFITNFIDNYQDILGITHKGNYKYNNLLRFNKNNNNTSNSNNSTNNNNNNKSSQLPFLKIKIYNGITQVFDLNNNKIDNFMENIKPNSKVQALIKCNGLWVYEKNWGLSLKVCKMIVKQSNILPEYPFLENSLNENENE